MPRTTSTTKCTPKKGSGPMAQKKREIQSFLGKTYGYSLSLTDVMRFLGFKHEDAAAKWLDGLLCTNVNGRRKWFAGDVAERYVNGMFQSTGTIEEVSI